MASRKCCVANCSATASTHRLYNIPKDDNLRELWLSFLIPVSPLLSGLSKQQLVNKRVCQKHFDRHQFDHTGNRLQHGYPCLFSAKEILHGIPLGTYGNHLSDHSYCLANTDDNIEMASASVVEGDHNMYAASTSSAPTHHEQPMDIDVTETTVGLKNVDVRHVVKKTKPSLKKVQNLERKKTNCFIKKIKKLASSESKKRMTFDERLNSAKDLSQDGNFIRNISKLNKPAQNFLYMQLKLAGKKKKAVRFTTDNCCYILYSNL